MIAPFLYAIIGALLIQNAFEFNKRSPHMSFEQAERVIYDEFVRVYNDDPYNPKDTMELDASEQCAALHEDIRPNDLVKRACKVINFVPTNN